MKARHLLPVLLSASALLFSVHGPRAAGFAIKEQSGTALGNAFAGATAGADDLSYMFFNPASLARQSGHQVLAIGSYIAPQSELQTGSASTAAPLGNVPIGGGLGGDDMANDAFVPAFYGMYSVNDDLKLGLGVNVPFGLVTEYEDGWIGRYHALRSDLMTVNVNPAVAYRINDMISVGAGLQAQYIDVELTNAIDFGSIGAASGVPGSVPTQQDGFAKVEGDDWGFGFNLGVLVEPIEGTRLGVAYRSKVSHELEGDATFDLGTGIGSVVAANSGGAFVDTGARASTDLPETLSFGFRQDIGDQWSVMGEAAWTRWSRFDELRIIFDNPAQSDSVTDESWDDSWFFAGGVTFRPNQNWTVRAGVAYDQTPIPDETRTPRIAGEDRLWLAAGATYRPMDNLEVGLAYTHIFLDDATLDLRSTGTGNFFRGDLSGEYENSIDIVSVQASYRF